MGWVEEGSDLKKSSDLKKRKEQGKIMSQPFGPCIPSPTRREAQLDQGRLLEPSLMTAVRCQ